MGSRLPFLTEGQFHQRLLQACPGCSDAISSTLYIHYSELRRWNRRLSLVGPGTAGEVVERHYGESLAALPLILSSDRSLLDIGSGAGFPGLVLALLGAGEMHLVEADQRKAAFLTEAARVLNLEIQVHACRIEDMPPLQADLVTARALAPLRCPRSTMPMDGSRRASPSPT